MSIERAKAALAKGKVTGAKTILRNHFSKEHRENWEKEKKEEYGSLFPKYRDMTELEYNSEVIDTSDPTNITLWEDLEEIPTKVVDYSNNPSYATFEEWILEQEYKALTNLEIEQKIGLFFAKEYAALRLNAYPSLGDLADALVKDFQALPKELKESFPNLIEYCSSCVKVKEMYPKEI